MPARYSVIRYVPDPIVGEFVNVGVVAADQDRAACRFVATWNRASALGKEPVGYVREFASWLGRACGEDVEALSEVDVCQFTVDSLQEIASNWHGSIQLTPPRSSGKNLEELVDEMSALFLREPVARAQAQRRTKRTAAKLAKDVLAKKIKDAQLNASLSLRTQFEVQGTVTAHNFDVAIVNHVPRVGINGLSFELVTSDQIQADINKTAFSMWDTRTNDPEFGLAVVAVGDDSEWTEQVERLCEQVGAEFIGEGRLNQWAGEEVKTLAASLA